MVSICEEININKIPSTLPPPSHLATGWEELECSVQQIMKVVGVGSTEDAWHTFINFKNYKNPLTYHRPRLELNSAGVDELHQLPEYVGLKLLYPNIEMGAVLLAALIPRFGLMTFM